MKRKVSYLVILSVLLGLPVFFSLGTYLRFQRAREKIQSLETFYPVYLSRDPEEAPEIKLEKARPQTWVPLGQISPLAVKAIVISEDSAFYSHEGLDFDQIKESFKKNLEKGTFARGGSTITQQTVKNLFLSRKKTIGRKLSEVYLSMEIEKLLNKKKILEIYLNIVEFGPNLYGIGPAAQYYFNKPASLLRAKEGAFLAMLLPNPKKYSASFRKKTLTAYASKTTHSILEKLKAVNAISEEEMQNEWAAPFVFEEHSTGTPTPQEIPEETEEVTEDL